MSDQHAHPHKDADEKKILWKSRMVLVGFLLVIAYFLWAEHRAHVIAFLPYVLLAACPLMHIFMHRGHGHHHGASSGEHKKKED